MRTERTHKSTVSVSLNTSKALQAIREGNGSAYATQKALERNWLTASPFGLFLAIPSLADSGRK